MTLEDYLKSMHRIDGWCSPLAARLLALFGQATQELPGDVLDIASIKGKSAIALGSDLIPRG